MTALVTDLQHLTPDTALFTIEVQQPSLSQCCATPGQFVQLSIPGGGEIPISVAGVPQDRTMELCIRNVGHVTATAHRLKIGDAVAVRGPFGKGFPVADWTGRDVLLIAGGLGIAPLRSLLLHLLANRPRFGRVTLMYGARDTTGLLFRDELYRLSCRDQFKLLLTVDLAPDDAPPESACRTGLVTDLLSAGEFGSPGAVAAVCGPPALYRCVVPLLGQYGLDSDTIFLSLERRMKCGVGLCCHCAVGDLFCCTDGPVFSHSQLQSVPGAL